MADPAVRSRQGSVEVRIVRSDPAHRATFAVPRREVFVVLDLVAWAAREDPTLAYRYSCRSGLCGSCTIQLDGVPVLGCQTPVPSRPVVHLAPLGGFPIVRDLVVDPSPFAERWDAIVPSWTPTDGPSGDAPPRPLEPSFGTVGAAAGDSLDCISCGACFAACDMASPDVGFLGPAALARSMVLVADPREGRRSVRLAFVSGRDGVDGCRGIGACSLVCPKDVDPQRAVRRLRRWRVAGTAP